MGKDVIIAEEDVWLVSEALHLYRHQNIKLMGEAFQRDGTFTGFYDNALKSAKRCNHILKEIRKQENND